MSETTSSYLDDETIEIEDQDNIPEGDVDLEDLVMDDPFNPAEISIISKADTLRNIIERLHLEEIDMTTAFQRNADLWDPAKMSRLIESILIRFPLPAFYFDASNDEKWLIVDGLQRLSAIRNFVDTKELSLRGLEYLVQFNGYKYDDLPRTYQRRIDECAVTLFLIQPGTPDPVKYSLFRRINTGGLVLNNQEIRNAMASTATRDYLRKLADYEYLKKTIGNQSKRMLDQELVLRYLAFKFMDYERSKKNITTFLDEMIEKLENSSPEELEGYQISFQRTMKRCWQLFGDDAFEKRVKDQSTRRRRKSSTLFEVWTNSLAMLTEEDMGVLLERKELLLQKNLDLTTEDNDYFRSITYSTQKKDHFRTRRDKVAEIIREVLDA